MDSDRVEVIKAFEQDAETCCVEIQMFPGRRRDVCAVTG